MDSRLLRQYPSMDFTRFSYIRLRSKGMTREESYRELFKAEKRLYPPYEQQMLDRIAIGDVMAEYHELTEPMAITVTESVDEFLRLHPKMETTMNRVRESILSPESFGDPATFPPWTEYRPPWTVGDVFCYTLEGYFPRIFRMEGKILLLYVAGDRAVRSDFTDSGFYEELVYLSICDEDKLPRNMDELNALGYLPGFTVFKEYQYLHALLIRREKELKSLKLRKLGNFPGSPRLFRERPIPARNALHIAPAYAGKNKTTLVRAACASYQHFGAIATAEQARMAKKDWNYGAQCRMERGEDPGNITMDEIPLGQLTIRTYFHHTGRMSERIPRRDTMILEEGKKAKKPL